MRSVCLLPWPLAWVLDFRRRRPGCLQISDCQRALQLHSQDNSNHLHLASPGASDSVEDTDGDCLWVFLWESNQRAGLLNSGANGWISQPSAEFFVLARMSGSRLGSPTMRSSWSPPARQRHQAVDSVATDFLTICMLITCWCDR